MNQIGKILNENGFSVTKRNGHVIEFNKGNQYIYYSPGSKLNLVVAPDIEIPAKYSCSVYHNSNLTAYPKKISKGTTEIHYGIKIIFDDISVFEDFIKWYVSKDSARFTINIAREPIKVMLNDGKSIITCPNCKDIFEKAPRCPECGQLIKF